MDATPGKPDAASSPFSGIFGQSTFTRELAAAFGGTVPGDKDPFDCDGVGIAVGRVRCKRFGKSTRYSASGAELTQIDYAYEYHSGASGHRDFIRFIRMRDSKGGHDWAVVLGFSGESLGDGRRFGYEMGDTVALRDGYLILNAGPYTESEGEGDGLKPEAAGGKYPEGWAQVRRSQQKRVLRLVPYADSAIPDGWKTPRRVDDKTRACLAVVEHPCFPFEEDCHGRTALENRCGDPLDARGFSFMVEGIKTNIVRTCVIPAHEYALVYSEKSGQFPALFKGPEANGFWIPQCVSSP